MTRVMQVERNLSRLTYRYLTPSYQLDKKGANHPSLLQNASDHSIGSDDNHLIDAVDLASMYD